MIGLNNTIAAKWPQYYVDLRGWLVNRALAAAGITPTGADLTALAADTFPASLMLDSIHLNDTGRRVSAAAIAQVIAKRGK